MLGGLHGLLKSYRTLAGNMGIRFVLEIVNRAPYFRGYGLRLRQTINEGQPHDRGVEMKTGSPDLRRLGGAIEHRKRVGEFSCHEARAWQRARVSVA